MSQRPEETITIDDKQYNVADLTDEARSQIVNLKFVESQLQQLNNEWAVADTARMAYTSALKREVESVQSHE